MAKILIVDDDPDVVEATQMFLEKDDHEVSSAVNRAEGMQAVEDFQPDLMILDCMMEEVDDGIVMAQELRRKGFSAPILMLTSIGKVMGMDFGKDEDIVPVDEFVEKPIDPKDLMEKVSKLLQKASA